MIAQAKKIILDRNCSWRPGTAGDIAAAFRKTVNRDDAKRNALDVQLDTRGR